MKFLPELLISLINSLWKEKGISEIEALSEALETSARNLSNLDPPLISPKGVVTYTTLQVIVELHHGYSQRLHRNQEGIQVVASEFTLGDPAAEDS